MTALTKTIHYEGVNSMAELDFTAEELKTEEWRPIADFELLYEVSSIGRIRHIGVGHGSRWGRVRALCVNPKSGYVQIGLSRKHRMHPKTVHVLVARAFLGPRPEGHEVNHIDGNKLNNRVQNLEYRTHLDNQQHASALGLIATGDRHGSRTCPGRLPTGDNHPARKHPEKVRRGIQHKNAKLTENAIREIRQSTEYQRILAVRFGVTQTHIGRIRRGLIWKHIK